MFHIYAAQYYQCKQAFNNGGAFSPVPYFLICRAIELELKAKHLESKSRAEVKKQYGHNLKKSYDALPGAEQVLELEQYHALERASVIYDIPNKGFEYVAVADAVTGFKMFPDLLVLDQAARKLIGSDA
jgi:hypothetical protein